jgi:hypothetical protein
MKAIKTTRNYPARLQSTRGLPYGHPWAHYSVGYQGQLLGGPVGLLDLCYTTPDGVEQKDYSGGVFE